MRIVFPLISISHGSRTGIVGKMWLPIGAWVDDHDSIIFEFMIIVEPHERKNLKISVPQGGKGLDLPNKLMDMLETKGGSLIDGKHLCFSFWCQELPRRIEGIFPSISYFNSETGFFLSNAGNTNWMGPSKHQS